jgi:nitrite reductase/ring-hydroxylating ferredoxin subunit
MLAAAVTGLADYSETYGKEMRWATAHGLTMVIVLIAMIVSLVLRYQPSAVVYFWAVVLSSLAYFLALAGGYLGGHLSFGFGTMVNRDAFFEGVTKWTPVGRTGDFPKNQLVRKQAGDMPVLVVRLDNRFYALSAVCSHAGGPLDEGKVSVDRVICPWHGSTFSLVDGRVIHGPANFAQPAFEVREHAGQIEVKLPRALH